MPPSRQFSSLKTEPVRGKVYETRYEARAPDLFGYIARFYNAVRPHSTIGYARLVDIERKVGLERDPT